MQQMTSAVISAGKAAAIMITLKTGAEKKKKINCNISYISFWVVILRPIPQQHYGFCYVPP
jgi:hypothetical protein